MNRYDGLCPECGIAERAPGQAYCKPCKVLRVRNDPPPRTKAKIRADACAMLCEQLAAQRKRWGVDPDVLLRADKRPSKRLKSYAPARKARTLRPGQLSRASLRLLSSTSGIAYATLCKRYACGDRDERLTRPVSDPKAARVGSVRQRLKELAVKHDLPLSTLQARWQVGRRGARLVGGRRGVPGTWAAGTKP